ncbi:hypothetical protein SAMN05421858_4261 [Haladaptatus litoreus]|uniref:Uncharacterized protein n=1 Tax=Haladaptatus litoreus TaxID=553468 RepID=A0A1N7EI18_9EURY|nr:hypothetical protein SAMN05421858_4261 [Haladaptatus litoreus]
MSGYSRNPSLGTGAQNTVEKFSSIFLEVFEIRYFETLNIVVKFRAVDSWSHKSTFY